MDKWPEIILQLYSLKNLSDYQVEESLWFNQSCEIWRTLSRYVNGGDVLGPNIENWSSGDKRYDSKQIGNVAQECTSRGKWIAKQSRKFYGHKGTKEWCYVKWQGKQAKASYSVKNAPRQ